MRGIWSFKFRPRSKTENSRKVIRKENASTANDGLVLRVKATKKTTTYFENS